jgi:hypothetical protein
MFTKVKRAAAFVAIVWSLAASFVAFEVASVESVDLARSYPGLVGDLMVSGAVMRSTNCTVASGEAPPAGATGISERQARGGAWSLGLRVGWEAQARQSATVQPATLAELRGGIETFAMLLGIPAPRPFEPVNVAMSNTEFVAAVERDPEGTAHALALRYSPDTCRHYKLGALWGATAIARAYVAGEIPAHAADIAYYARQIGLPDSLWRPMTGRTAAAASSPALSQESQALTDAMTQYLMREQGTPGP